MQGNVVLEHVFFFSPNFVVVATIEVHLFFS